MSVFLILIPISLALAVAFVILCLASIRDGQFDDLESPRWRILFDGPYVHAESPETHSAVPARKTDDQG